MSDCFVKLNIGNSTVFSINTDGTYVRTISQIDTIGYNSDIISQDECLLQCYSNGHINKVYVSELMQLRVNFTFSHGIYPSSLLQFCGVCTDDDFVISLFEKSNQKLLSIISVKTLTSHTLLGLKGCNIIKTIYDNVLKWYILPKKQSINLKNLIAHCSRYSYIAFDSSDNKEFAKEFLWINENIIISCNDVLNIEQVNTQISDNDIIDDTSFDFSSLIGIEKQDVLRDKFSSYLQIGRNIPIGQSHVKDILSLCTNKDDFWRVIKCLLECNVIIYRSPIVSYFKSNIDRLYAPDYEILNSVMKLIFSSDEKIEKNLEFLYPFRMLLTKDDLSIVKDSSKDLSLPEHIHILGEILNYTSKDLIDFCLEKASVASYYCIYEILKKCYKNDGVFCVNKLIDSISDRLDNGSIKGNLLEALIENDFKKQQNKISSDIIKIKTGGYTEYSKLCYSYEGKKKHKESLDNITTLVGKKVNVRHTRTYQNHYLMTYLGIRVLLPKSMTTEKLSEGAVVNVYIAIADKVNKTLFATQKFPVDYRKIIQTPLLNIGDIIEVTFDLNGRPIPHKCYKKVKISLLSIPKTVDYKARYQAKVVRQDNDKYHYLVKLI